jgi:hypothetical protein
MSRTEKEGQGGGELTKRTSAEAHLSLQPVHWQTRPSSAVMVEEEDAAGR